jgi:hypothetical protein
MADGRNSEARIEVRCYVTVGKHDHKSSKNEPLLGNAVFSVLSDPGTMGSLRVSCHPVRT